jgi:hypothetical protein
VGLLYMRAIDALIAEEAPLDRQQGPAGLRGLLG